MWALLVTTWLYASASASNAQWIFAGDEVRGIFASEAECHRAELLVRQRGYADRKVDTACVPWLTIHQ